MGYKVNEKEYDFNSNVNQDIKRKFIEREVNVCVSSIVEFILEVTRDLPYNHEYNNDAPFRDEDVVNMYSDNSDDINDVENEMEELEEKRDSFQEQLDELESELEDEPQRTELKSEISELEKEIEKLEKEIDVLEDKKTELENEDGEYAEVYEWWDVSSWLCDRLEEHGEVVIPHMGYWGRQTTGQSIYLDYIVSEICYEMEILEGQEHSWENMK